MKKKNILITMVFLSVACVSHGLGQGITDAEKQQVLQDLRFDGFLTMDSTSQYQKVLDALSEAEEYQIVEAIPIIRSKIWSCSETLQYVMMRILYHLKDPDVHAITKAIVDTATSIFARGPRKNPQYFADPELVRNDAILQLFELGDYTYVDKFFQYITEMGGLSAPLTGASIHMVAGIAKAVPAYRDSVKNALLKVMVEDTSVDADHRGSAAVQMVIAMEYFLPDLVTYFENTVDRSTTNAFIAEEIAPLKYPPFENALKLKLTSNQELQDHADYVGWLLKYYGSPNNYQFVVTYAANQQDQSTKGRVLFDLQLYVPDTPSVNISVSTLLDSLSSFTQQSRNLNWLGSSTFANTLVTYISTARTNLSGQDSNGCAIYVKQFQNAVNTEYLDTLNQTPDFVTIGAWKFLYYNAQYILNRLPQSPCLNVKLVNSVGVKLPGGSLQYYDGSWKPAVNNNDGTFTISTTLKTVSLQMTYAYGTQTKSNVTVGSDTVVFQTVNAQVKLQNSQGSLMDTGTVQYYAGAWRNFGTTTNGIATMELLPVNYSLSMTYAYASNNKVQDLSANPIVVFQTTNTSVQLKNSQGNLMDTGTVQYYSGAWRTFGTTTNGVTTKELLPNSYSFSMTYAFASNTKQQDIGANPTVVFQTVNAAVQLKNSQGSLIDQGTVQYYSGAWRTFATTSGGVTTKELLPNGYSFSMTYAYASNNKQQDIGANSTVVFQTVNAAVQLKNSQGSYIGQGTVQYYSGAWRTFGTTSGGVTTKELLPNSYSFMMTYAYASNTKQQDLNSNPMVVFQTVNTTVQLKNSQGNLMDTGKVQYYSGAWRTFGTTTNGAVSLELLPTSYQFSMTYAYVSNNKTQDVGSNSTVSFSTVLATVNVINTQNNPVNNAAVTYYSGAWRPFGNTVSGNATKELLPANLQFRAQLGSVSQNKTQDLSTNPLVVITLNVGQ